MADFGLEDWEDVAELNDWPAVLLGNGASRAVSAKFSYRSLYNVAPLNDDDRDLFEALGTNDFEEVLNHLLTSRLVCEQLGHDLDDVQDRYDSVREALINAVHSHHVTWEEVNDGNRLASIRQALLAYEDVFTTSYDLLIYWAMMNAGDPPGSGFGDLFWNATQTFDPLDTDAFGDKTMVYWLHGGLQLYRTGLGETRKRTNAGANLLAIFGDGGRVPLFVSEGTSEQKRRAIRRSEYLMHAYKTLLTCEANLVVFGQALGPPDAHIVQAIRRTPHRHMAYGILAKTAKNANLQRAQIEALFPQATIEFFDSRTHPLGAPTLLVP